MKTAWLARYLVLSLIVGACLYPLLYFSDELLVSVGFRTYRHPSFVVHVDLKAAPPRIDYLLNLMSWLGSLDVSGVLLEYEGFFPFDQRLHDLASPHCFSHEDVSDMVLTAERMGMDVIPYIQTFTNLEYIGRHTRLLGEFENSVHSSWSACHRSPVPEDLICEVVDQILSLHPNSRYVYIGASTLSERGMKRECLMHYNGTRMVELYLEHLQFIANHLHLHWPEVTVLASADVLAEATAGQLKALADFIEPVVVDAGPAWRNETVQLLRTGSAAFRHVWGASAFKCSQQPSSNYVYLQQTVANHQLWQQHLLEIHKKRYRGLFMMGPARVGQCAPLCELLPVALPSLVLALEVMDTNFTLAVGHKSALRLGFNGFVYDRPFIEEGRLNFPGSNVFRVVSELEVTMNDNKERESISIDGDFLHRISSSLSVVYPGHVVNEWLRRKVFAWTDLDVHSQLQPYEGGNFSGFLARTGHFRLGDRGLVWLGQSGCER